RTGLRTRIERRRNGDLVRRLRRTGESEAGATATAIIQQCQRQEDIVCVIGERGRDKGRGETARDAAEGGASQATGCRQNRVRSRKRKAVRCPHTAGPAPQ